VKEMKNVFNGLISLLNTAREIKDEFEEKLIETSPTKIYTGKRIYKNNENRREYPRNVR
jgi:hypothetical protein